MKAEPTVVLEGYTYFECPRWREGRVWVSDFYTHQVLSANEDGSDVRVEAEVPHQPSGLGWLPDGRLLVVSMRDQTVLRREENGDLVVHADLSAHATGNANDMHVDADGRAYVGNFGFDLMNMAPIETASLLRVEPDGSVHEDATDLHFPNGMAVTAGGDLLVDETLGNRISAFAIGDDGVLGPRRDWAVLGPMPESTDMAEGIGQVVVAPDGCALAQDGTLWAADALGQRIVQIREGEGVVDELTFDTGVFACGFGGDDGRTLFVCAAPDFNEHARKDEREGRLLSVRI
ncbi:MULTISPECIES: SMP-30/gluconolactonase/LRE family protein [unclassified Rhodococcus (in: high G+C Gram-positive bacteria)]|jgi:sugar lactone lactonase YvrE|uniref:SMP-30/gluconolactonase/LRE family protein n=1 Tax=unclassified Rhodococcus (in: high G+C Gram-positive bacteria) TaxID=192944 RepID=UPI0004802379|nr:MULTISPECIES: SMP-30/gluconolactonase/LRE family protein [unclassified Rhodococcus (in: high G+C Gram-positive bacteria)]KQU36122.1 gluconolactonase [Rhodococcus sp. Leaf225]KQU48670.1 gluconolactonase [Rhodococcus sp. Leaf258]MBY6677103.1 SMP-30/gluconolactonase/LRE family protein [Rhodococcus sp. BP-332]MBY6680403.1 SMP-30/gluconolactonase/LRE family protein [Rhodococcus sp. BP-316]MBY6684757.1 SMP-30/gluconolactonase/LRE family protein [Rhodococcus sp. BP-288]